MASKGSTGSGAAASRQAAAQLRAKQRAASRRQAGLYGLVALLLLGGFVAAIMVILKSSSDASTEYQVYNATNGTSFLASADASGGILIGQDGTVGGAVPADAVRVEIYEDPLCPVCRQFDLATAVELTYLRENGDIAYYYHPIAILDRYSAGTRYSTRSVSALATVAEYDPVHFAAFVEGLFANQPAENTKGLTNAEIADVARTAGVSEEAIAKIAEGEFRPWVLAATEQASIDGVNATPTIRIAGVDQPFWYYRYFPGILTYDALVVTRGGADALVAVAAEREAAASSGTTEEEVFAAVQALLLQQVAELEAGAGATPSPAPSASS